MVTLRIQGTPGNYADSESELVLLPNGDLVASWWGGTPGDRSDIFVRQFTADGDGALVVLRTTRLQGMGGLLHDDKPQIALLSDGGFVVTWNGETGDGQGRDIFVQRFDNTGVAGGEGVVRLQGAAGAFEDTLPEVAALAGGGYAVTWQAASADGTGSDIYLQRFDATGMTLTAGPVRISADTEVALIEPDITALTTGGFVVTWHGATDGSPYSDIHVRHYAADGMLLSSAGLEGSATTTDSHGRVVALDGGGFALAWRSDTAANAGSVMLHRFDAAGQSVGSTLTLPDAALNVAAPAIAARPDGGVILAWHGSTTDGQGTDIFVQAVAADGSLGPAARLRGVDGSSADTAPEVAVLDTGRYVVAWVGATPDFGADVFVQEFATNGTAGALYRWRGVEETGADWRPLITPMDGNTYAVTWGFGTTGGQNSEIGVQIVCFTAGTRIAVPGGERAVEDLAPGDLVLTRDHGAQPLRWSGRRRLTANELARNPRLRPVRIAAGALGPGRPVADLLVSPQHRVLLRSPALRTITGTEEALVAARLLVGRPGIAPVPDGTAADYVHLLFDRHEIVLSNGAETESLYTGPEALKALDPDTVAELHALFPDLLLDGSHRARPFLDRRGARRLAAAGSPAGQGREG